jgi:hypothetical protein
MKEPASGSKEVEGTPWKILVGDEESVIDYGQFSSP